MGLSIGGISSYGGSMAAIEPINYSIKNGSKVSDSFEESMGKVHGDKAFSSVESVAPVLYPNAQVVDPVKNQQQIKETAKQFNQVAASFQGMTTGYDRGSGAMGYDMVGSSFDAFA